MENNKNIRIKRVASNLEKAVDYFFVLYGEMIEDNGEDSYAVCVNGDVGVISAFDGCGGIGSRKYPEYDGKTGAYVASRVCSKALLDWFCEIPNARPMIKPTNLQDSCISLASLYLERLVEANSSVAKTMMKGALSKSFPTTVSSVFFRCAKSSNVAMFTWAGDSRGYLLTPDGLIQVTVDDVLGDENALTNLKSDGNLKNYLCAEGGFSLNYRSVEFDKEVVLITSTDGCFGYFSTPMEFEYMLLETMAGASDEEEWKEALRKYILKYTGDDYTLGVVSCGFGGFEKMKAKFAPRKKELYDKYISRIPGASESELEDMWNEYRTYYYGKQS